MRILLVKPRPRLLGKPFRFELPRLENLYLASRWVVLGGGLPAAAVSGRHVAQTISAQARRMFTATAA